MLQCSIRAARIPTTRKQTMNTDKYTEAGKAAAQSVATLSGKALQGMEQLATLNLQALETLLGEAGQHTLAVLDAKSPQEVAALQMAALQAWPGKAAAYLRQVQEILAGVGESWRGALEAQFGEIEAKSFEALDGMLKDVPGHKEALALARSAISSAKIVLADVDQTTRRVSGALGEQVATLALPQA
jgi:phasin family protein